jgi:hypothetical protein
MPGHSSTSAEAGFGTDNAEARELCCPGQGSLAESSGQSRFSQICPKPTFVFGIHRWEPVRGSAGAAVTCSRRQFKQEQNGHRRTDCSLANSLFGIEHHVTENVKRWGRGKYSVAMLDKVVHVSVEKGPDAFCRSFSSTPTPEPGNF